VVRIPPLRAADSGALVAVNFDVQVLRYGDRFDGVPQRVNSGNASGEFDGAAADARGWSTSSTEAAPAQLA
jgi:hypothetical protein